MQEIAPGVVHWTAWRDTIGKQVSSYLLVAGRVLLDPMPPPDGGFDALAEAYGAPAVVLLTNRHHYRASGEIAARYGATVHCHEAGMHAFIHGEPVQPFRWGDELPGGAIAEEVGVLCDEETAFWFPAERSLAFADALMRWEADDAPGLVPDFLRGDDPAAVGAGMRAALRRLAALDPDNLLLAHGAPVVGGGRATLEEVGAG